jgi:hypothetical protein
MPIRLAEPPRATLEAVQETLSKRAERSDFATRALREAPPDELALAAPHPVYTLGLRSLVEGEGLESAELTGWRYLVQRGDTTIASAEVHIGAAGAETRGLEVNEGPFVRATEAAIAKAEELPNVERATYELRLLRIPAVYVVALWLKTNGEGEDILIPIGETPPELETDRPYGPRELSEALAEPARRQLEFDSSPGTRKPRER